MIVSLGVSGLLYYKVGSVKSGGGFEHLHEYRKGQACDLTRTYRTLRLETPCFDTP